MVEPAGIGDAVAVLKRTEDDLSAKLDKVRAARCALEGAPQLAKPARVPRAKPAKRVVSEETRAKMRAAHARRLGKTVETAQAAE